MHGANGLESSPTSERSDVPDVCGLGFPGLGPKRHHGVGDATVPSCSLPLDPSHLPPVRVSCTALRSSNIPNRELEIGQYPAWHTLTSLLNRDKRLQFSETYIGVYLRGVVIHEFGHIAGLRDLPLSTLSDSVRPSVKGKCHLGGLPCYQITVLPTLRERTTWVGSRHSCTSSRFLCVCPVPGRSHEWTAPCALPSGPPSISPSEVGWAFWIAE